MSFIGTVKQGKVYAPGYFLAHAECTRDTREIPVTLGTSDGETVYVKMGTIYPSNDGNAEGIVYEDVDVTTGNMPGSVVTKGDVYAERLANAEDYTAVTNPSGNPKSKGWYTKSNGVYAETTDTTVQQGTTYYEKGITAAAKTALEAAGFKFIV